MVSCRPASSSQTSSVSVPRRSSTALVHQSSLKVSLRTSSRGLHDACARRASCSIFRKNQSHGTNCSSTVCADDLTSESTHLITTQVITHPLRRGGLADSVLV